jgi:hypothetical protein
LACAALFEGGTGVGGHLLHHPVLPKVVCGFEELKNGRGTSGSAKARGSPLTKTRFFCRMRRLSMWVLVLRVLFSLEESKVMEKGDGRIVEMCYFSWI